MLLSVLQKGGKKIEIKPGRDRFTIIIGFVLLLSSIYLYLTDQAPDPTSQSPIEPIYITGIRFSSSCLDSDDNLLQIDLQKASLDGIPAYYGCNLKFQDISVSSPETAIGFKAKVEFYANDVLIGTTEEKDLEKFSTVFKSVTPLKSANTISPYWTWAIPGDWKKIDVKLLYFTENSSRVYSNKVSIVLNRNGTAYLVIPPIIKIQSVNYSINNGDEQTVFAGSPDIHIDVAIGDKITINSISYRAYSNTNTYKIHSYLIKWEVSKGRSYLVSSEFSTPDQETELGLKEIKGLPWTVDVLENNSLGIYLVRSDGSYADYMGINFIYK